MTCTNVSISVIVAVASLFQVFGFSHDDASCPNQGRFQVLLELGCSVQSVYLLEAIDPPKDVLHYADL